MYYLCCSIGGHNPNRKKNSFVSNELEGKSGTQCNVRRFQKELKKLGLSRIWMHILQKVNPNYLKRDLKDVIMCMTIPFLQKISLLIFLGIQIFHEGIGFWLMHLQGGHKKLYVSSTRNFIGDNIDSMCLIRFNPNNQKVVFKWWCERI